MSIGSNYDSVLQQITSAGLVIDRARGLLVDQGGFERCKVEGRSGKPGWYRLYSLRGADGGVLIVGSYGVSDWAANDHGATKIRLNRDQRKTLNVDQLAAERARIESDRKSEDARMLARQERAAAQASAWWRQCAPSGRSSYLERKGFTPGALYGARCSPSGNTVIPVQDHAGRVWGLQVIYCDPEARRRKKRDKDFTPGTVKRGHWFGIGSLAVGGVALVCEGFATGASLHEATGLPVVVAFDAGNLLPVALNLVERWRGMRLLFCADDDYDWQQNGKINAGIEAAKAAALATDGRVVWPEFPAIRPVGTHKGPTDFNDLHVHPSGGLHVVRAQIDASLSASGWRLSAAQGARVATVSEGAGDGGRRPLRSNISIDEARERWVFVYGGNDLMFDRQEHVLVPRRDVMTLLPDHAWREWKRSGLEVCRLSEVGFDPGGKDQAVLCNLWGGWPTVPREGNCSSLLELLRFLCSDDPDGDGLYQWVLRWLAYPIQHPGAKMRSTLVFHGLQGAGKNLIFETVMAIYGEYGRVIDQSAIEDKYNDFASRKLFLVADEVVARSDLYHVKNKLKAMITGAWIRINPKHIAAYDERNHVNMVFLSNEYLPAVIEVGDRRHCVIWTPPSLSEEFYRECKAELNAGGREALHWFLLHLPLGDFDEHTKPPMTKAKSDVQELSAGSIERFVRDWIAGETNCPVCPCASGQVYLAYQRWCTARGEKARAQNHLSGYLGKQPGFSIQLKDCFKSASYGGASIRRRMVIPPESLLHRAEVGATDYRKPASQTETQWITDCYYVFQAALGGESDV